MDRLVDMQGATTEAGGNEGQPHVVIIGGGFAGLRAARRLRRAPVRVTLIDRQNHHLFQPLLYQVATAGLGGPDIAAPLRKVVRRSDNTAVWMASVTAVDRLQRLVLTDKGPLAYDFLVLAAGASHSYFGHPQWARHAAGLKSLDDALGIRRSILESFEAAETEFDPDIRRAMLTFAIVGAGPTGVELAGAIAEMARHTLAEDHRNFDPREARVILLEQADRVLPGYPSDLSAKAEAQLCRLGVEVRTATAVSSIGACHLKLGDETIACHTVLWAAGVSASALARTLATPTDRSGRVLVDRFLQVPGDTHVFAVGDVAAVEMADGSYVPGVAPAALQQGAYVARAIRRWLSGKPIAPFRYRDKGSMATIGRSAAVAEVAGLRFGGLFAWLAWLFVHIVYLVGFRNRISVLFNWTWAYVTYQRGARIILGASNSEAKEERPPCPPAPTLHGAPRFVARGVMGPRPVAARSGGRRRHTNGMSRRLEGERLEKLVP